MEEYEKFKKAALDLRMSKDWNDLPQGPIYNSDRIAISVAHSKINLVRAGQQQEGGKNYWDSPPALNNALLQVLTNDKSIMEKALQILKSKKNKALLGCQKFITELEMSIKEIKD